MDRGGDGGGSGGGGERLARIMKQSRGKLSSEWLAMLD